MVFATGCNKQLISHHGTLHGEPICVMQVMARDNSNSSMEESCSFSSSDSLQPSSRRVPAHAAVQRCMVWVALAAAAVGYAEGLEAPRWQHPVVDVNLERYEASWPPKLSAQERAEIAMPEAMKARVLYDTELGSRRKLLVSASCSPSVIGLMHLPQQRQGRHASPWVLTAERV